MSKELENWMGLLPSNVRELSVIYLAIPGSHNTMTYGITKKSRIAPDAEDSVRKIWRILPCIVRRWAITQKKDIVEQLNGGIRFFDLRLVVNSSKFYFAHGLYSFEINDSLYKIRTFLDEHPLEFVILDFQHFYKFSQKDHENLQAIIRTIFATKIYGKIDGVLENCSLKNAEITSKQIVIIYRVKDEPKDMWAGYYWPTPWPDTIKVTRLKEFLSNSLQIRDPSTGYVSQCILTPTLKYILPRLFSSIKGVAKKVNKNLTDWIMEQRPGKFDYNSMPRANVFLGDFIDLNDYEFCKLIIGLNKCLEV